MNVEFCCHEGFPGVLAAMTHASELFDIPITRITDDPRSAVCNELGFISFSKTPILGAWSTTYRLLDVHNALPYFWWTSPVLQTEMHSETSFVKLLKDNRERMLLADNVAAKSLQLSHLPCPFNFKKTKQIDLDIAKPYGISLFGPKCARKNWLNQIIAITHSAFKDLIVLHLNNDDEQVIDLLKLLDINYVLHPWMSETEYDDFLKDPSIILSLNCTISESFNYCAATNAVLGRPTIIGPCVPYAHLTPDIVANPLYPASIASRIDHFLCDHLEILKFRQWSGVHFKQFLAQQNHDAAETLKAIH